MLSKKNILYLTLLIQIIICLFIFKYEFLNIGPIYFQAQLFIVVLFMFLTKLLFNKNNLHGIYTINNYKYSLVILYPLFSTILIMYSASVTLYEYEGYFDPISSTAVILFSLFPLYCILLIFRKKLVLSSKQNTYTIILGFIMYVVFFLLFRFTNYALDYYANIKVHNEVINLISTFLLLYYSLYIYKIFNRHKVIKY